VQAFLRSLVNRSDVLAWLADECIGERFLSRFREWIQSSMLNRLTGLSAFPEACFSQGATESFPLFYAKHRRRRFRCLKGEYFYHRLSWRNHYPGWAFIDGEHPLADGDALVLSLPFADTGNKHPDMETLIAECDTLRIPVLVDCTYFGLCRDIRFDLDRPSIEVLTFSLSKAFPVGHVRIGMRLARRDDDDPLSFMNKERYINRVGAAVGEACLKEFDVDYSQRKWRARQLEVCEELGIEPSNTVIFGIGGLEYRAYNRGGSTNRLCLNDYFESRGEVAPKGDMGSVSLI